MIDCSIPKCSRRIISKMPLYNNILSSKSKPSASNAANTSTATNSASLRFLQDHLLSKKRAKQCNPVQAKEQQKPLTDKNQIVTERALHKSIDGDWNLEDEYDPMVPNSYELLLAEYIKAEERRLVRIRSAKIDPSILGILDKLEGDDSDSDVHQSSVTGTAIAPPPSLSTNPSTVDDLNVTPGKSSMHAAESSTDQSSTKLDGTSAAAKIMSKMGYKAGQGLGRDEQGISTPLEVQKSTDNTCWLIQKSIGQPQPPKQPDQKPVVPVNEKETVEPEDKVSSLLKDSTRVLLLQNMVGPGEVDDELETETKEECKKYGEVIKCLIYEIPNKRVPDDEAVRIFVEFKSVESAIKAVSDLNGRYFGGRVVRASFYDLERFRSYNLGI